MKKLRPRNPTRQELEEIKARKPIYKQVKVTGEHFFSCFCGKAPKGYELASEVKIDLEYPIGKVVRAISGSPGIYCYRTEGIATQNAEIHHDMWTGLGFKAAALRVVPLGKTTRNRDRNDGVFAPAVFVQAVVYLEK